MKRETCYQMGVGVLAVNVGLLLYLVLSCEARAQDVVCDNVRPFAGTHAQCVAALGPGFEGCASGPEGTWICLSPRPGAGQPPGQGPGSGLGGYGPAPRPASAYFHLPFNKVRDDQIVVARRVNSIGAGVQVTDYVRQVAYTSHGRERHDCPALPAG